MGLARDNYLEFTLARANPIWMRNGIIRVSVFELIASGLDFGAEDVVNTGWGNRLKVKLKVMSV